LYRCAIDVLAATFGNDFRKHHSASLARSSSLS
jgi:hypothetical protein